MLNLPFFFYALHKRAHNYIQKRCKNVPITYIHATENCYDRKILILKILKPTFPLSNDKTGTQNAFTFFLWVYNQCLTYTYFREVNISTDKAYFIHS
jgi:hypothetical protein